MKKFLLVLFVGGLIGVNAQHPTAVRASYVGPNSEKYKILSIMIDIDEYEEFIYGESIDKVKKELLILKEKFYEDTKEADRKRDKLVKKRINIRKKAEKDIAVRDDTARNLAHDYITAPGIKTYKVFREQIIENINFAIEYEDKVINKMTKEVRWFEKQLRENSKLTLEGVVEYRENIAKREAEMKKRKAKCRRWHEIKSAINTEMPNLPQVITESVSATK